jgi:hypothetical protein
MNVEDIKPSKISKTQKNILNIVWFHLYEIPMAVKFIDTECRIVIARGWKKGEIGTYCLLGIKFWLGLRKIFWDDYGDNCTTMWMYLVSWNCTLKVVKMVNFMYPQKQRINLRTWTFMLLVPRWRGPQTNPQWILSDNL